MHALTTRSHSVKAYLCWAVCSSHRSHHIFHLVQSEQPRMVAGSFVPNTHRIVARQCQLRKRKHYVKRKVQASAKMYGPLSWLSLRKAHIYGGMWRRLAQKLGSHARHAQDYTKPAHEANATYTGVSSKSADLVEVDARLNLRMPLSVMKQLATKQTKKKKKKHEKWKSKQKSHAEPSTSSEGSRIVE